MPRRTWWIGECARSTARDVVVERGEAEEAPEERTRRRRGRFDHRFEVVDAVEGDDGGDGDSRVAPAALVRRVRGVRGVRGAWDVWIVRRFGGDLHHHLAAGRFAQERDAVRVDVEAGGVGADEADGIAQVVELRGVEDVRRQAVVDREPREAGLRQRLEQRRDVRHLVTRFPAAAVRDDHGRERTGRAALNGRYVGVELQAVRRREDDVLVKAGRAAGRGAEALLAAAAAGTPLAEEPPADEVAACAWACGATVGGAVKDSVRESQSTTRGL